MAEGPHRRRLPWIVLPAIIVVVVVAGWSVFWFRAESRANEVIDSWLARESAAGRQYTCVDRKIGGYPFEINVRCSEITVELPGKDVPVVARAAGFVGVAEIGDPRHIIIELKGPLLIGPADGKPTAALSWQLAQASVVGGPSSSDERISVVLEKPVLRRTAGAELGRADHLELHGRPDPDTSKRYDVLVHASQIVAPHVESWFGGPLDAELQLGITGIDRVPRVSLSELARRFAAADGKIDVVLMRLAAPDIAAEARGSVALDARGRPQGRLIVTGRAAPSLLDDILPTHDADLVRFGFALLGQPAVLGGKRATLVEVDARNGKLTIGPIKVGAIPPLYSPPGGTSAADKAP